MENTELTRADHCAWVEDVDGDAVGRVLVTEKDLWSVSKASLVELEGEEDVAEFRLGIATVGGLQKYGKD